MIDVRDGRSECLYYLVTYVSNVNNAGSGEMCKNDFYWYSEPDILAK